MNVLFITSGSIGDAIISSGIFNHLAEQYPQARFTVAGGSAAVSVFEAFPRLDRIICVIKKPRNRHWIDLWLEVCGQKWDIVVDLRGSLISFLLYAKKRYVFFKPDKSKSKSEQLAAMMKLNVPPPTKLWSSAEAKANAAKLLPEDKDVILLAPKTNSAAKDWPIERFAELAQRLCTEKTVFAVLAAQAQKESVQPIIQALPKENVLDLSGATDLLTAYAIMERSKLFIGNDSGLLHMAAASGMRCVGLYGPSNDKVYAPRGPHVTIVKSYDFAMGEEEKRDNKYMQMLSVDQVEQAARAVIA